MLGLFGKAKTAQAKPATPVVPPERVTFAGAPDFVLAEHLDRAEGFPYLRWAEVHAWVEAIPQERQLEAWIKVTDAWDATLCEALGPRYRLDSLPGAVLISTLEPHLAQAALEFMQKTRKRIERSLEGVAATDGFGNDLLVVFDDEDSYYRFIARFYPQAGEFAMSGGIQVNDGGCIYYATTKGHLRDVERVVAHEMTHGAVSHLPLPVWLNEGIAVNMEHRLIGNGPSAPWQAEMRAKHLRFWNPHTAQRFWCGESFHEPGDSNMLSYDLARILVEQFAADWQRFAAFVRAADWRDGGAAAAREQLGISLGVAVAAMHEQEAGAAAFEPQPSSWPQPAAST